MTSPQTCQHFFPNTEPQDNPCGAQAWWNSQDKCMLHSGPIVREEAAVYNFIRHRSETHKGKLLRFDNLTLEKLEFRDSEDFGNGCPILFNHCSFLDCNFIGSSFRNIELDDCTFKNCQFARCTFENAIFRSHFKETHFALTDFIGHTASFSHCDFCDIDVLFSGCNFVVKPLKDGTRGVVDFIRSTIKSCREAFSLCRLSAAKLDFSLLSVESQHFRLALAESHVSHPDYWSLTLLDVPEVVFKNFELQGKLTIHQSSESQRRAFALDFMSTLFDRMDSVRFTDVNLKKASFWRCNIESIHFIGCSWIKEGKYLKLYDEVEYSKFGNPLMWSEIIRLYTQLKKNDEDHRNYIDAGHWFYREMEARRRLMILGLAPGCWSEFSSRFCSFSWWYKAISNYGESQKRPLFWIGAILMVFAVAYSYCGVGFADGTPQYGLSNFDNGFVYSLLVMTFQFGKTTVTKDHVVMLLASTQLLLTAIVVPLFLLAVRRKFRR